MTGRVMRWRMRGGPKGVSPLQVETADSFWRRFLGLMGRKSLGPDRALLLSPCSSVHMCFMRFPIDVIYLRREGDDRDFGSWRTVKVVRDLRPWIGLSACPGAEAVLEMPSGEAERLGIQSGTIWDEVSEGHN